MLEKLDVEQLYFFFFSDPLKFLFSNNCQSWREDHGNTCESESEVKASPMMQLCTNVIIKSNLNPRIVARETGSHHNLITQRNFPGLFSPTQTRRAQGQRGRGAVSYLEACSGTLTPRWRRCAEASHASSSLCTSQ